MQYLKSDLHLYETMSQYHYFLIDIWGVVQKEDKLIENFEQFYQFLLDQNKNFLFLSNSPRPSTNVCARLTNLGLKNLKNDHIITSGDFFLELEQDIVQNKYCYYLGDDDHPLRESSKLQYVTNIKDAEYILVSALIEENDSIEKFDIYLNEAYQNNLHMLCPNPDKVAPTPTGFCYPPGFIAERYLKIGGRVSYYGKPYTGIYDFALHKLGPNIDKSKILMIGDSLVTDILGANNFGIDSLLCLTGTHQNDELLEDLINEINIKPTYIAQSLSGNIC